MINLIGEYEATLDAKGRFLLPAGLKKQLPAGDQQCFVVTRGFEGCLSLYPIQSWAELQNKINQLNAFDPKVRDFRRKFFSGALEIEPDSAGRVLLPANLRGFAGLGKDIVIASANNYIEIWDSAKYSQLFENMSPEAFSNLAEEVMAPLQQPRP
jgi:MraZ protein